MTAGGRQHQPANAVARNREGDYSADHRDHRHHQSDSQRVGEHGGPRPIVSRPDNRTGHGEDDRGDDHDRSQAVAVRRPQWALHTLIVHHARVSGEIADQVMRRQAKAR
jgi:hypothetical protein